MKYALVALVAVLGLSACAQLDAYLPREVQCMLVDVAQQKAAEQGLSLAQYINLEELVVCAPEAAVVEDVTVVE